MLGMELGSLDIVCLPKKPKVTVGEESILCKKQVLKPDVVAHAYDSRD